MTRLKAACLFCLLTVLAVLTTTVAAPAQEGHPMTGTWSGDFVPAGAKRIQITLILGWDGKAVTGYANPGPDKIIIKTITVDSVNQKWAVHFETDTKDAACNMAHFVADGKLDNLGSPNRTISGTYTFGTTKGDFKIRRD
jgi:hypothetical protein